MANYKNYSISAKKSKLYLKAKVPTEGYEEVIYGTNADKKTYHKYEDSIKGKPTHFESKTFTFEGRELKFLELTLTDGDDLNKLSIPLKNKGGYTNEVKALISSMNDLDITEEVTLSVRTSKYTTKAGVEKENLNIYINYVNILGENNKGLSTGYIPFSDVPPAIKEVDDDGDVTWDWKPVNKFYSAKLKDILSKFGNTETPAAPVQVPVAQVPATKKAPVNVAAPIEEDELDDLPF